MVFRGLGKVIEPWAWAWSAREERRRGRKAAMGRYTQGYYSKGTSQAQWLQRPRPRRPLQTGSGPAKIAALLRNLRTADWLVRALLELYLELYLVLPAAVQTYGTNHVKVYRVPLGAPPRRVTTLVTAHGCKSSRQSELPQ